MTRVDYHVHTEFSYDSRVTIEAALERAVASNIDVLCVTDHDTIDGAVKLMGMRCPQVRVLIGCEFTCDDGSHVIGLDLRDMIAEKDVFAIAEKVKLQGGWVLLPHPFRRGSGIFRNEMKRSEEFVRRVLSLTDMVECFNGRDTYENNQRSLRFVMRHGLHGVAGSDAHGVAALGSVLVEYDQEDFVHGASARRISCPGQPAAAENPVKRRAMEFYHRHKSAFPPVVDRTYRSVRTWLKATARRERAALPRIQLEFPAAGDGSGARERTGSAVATRPAAPPVWPAR